MNLEGMLGSTPDFRLQNMEGRGMVTNNHALKLNATTQDFRETPGGVKAKRLINPWSAKICIDQENTITALGHEAREPACHTALCFAIYGGGHQ